MALIISAFQDVGLVNKLEALVRDSAKKLDLPYTNIAIRELERERYGRLILGGDMEVGYDGKIIDIMIESERVKAAPHEVVKAEIEHEVCHCKDFQEGIYRVEVFCKDDTSGNNRFYPLAIELDKSYSDYFAFQRQIRVFGEESARTMLLHGLDEFYWWVDQEIMEKHEMLYMMRQIGGNILREELEAMKANQFSAVFSLFKEYIKCELIGHKSKFMKKSIVDVSRMLMKTFDAVHATPVDWIEKTAMLFYAGIVMNLEISLLESYMENDIVGIDGRLDGGHYKLFRGSLPLTMEVCDPTLDKIDDLFK